jgi:hypothetical protein
MQIHKVGREWPRLYKGRYSIPRQVEMRLAVANSHLLLAQGAMFNAKVDLLYLVIDNTLSAIVISKEGQLTTRDHKRKIEKMFKHLGNRPKLRSIERRHFDKFYDLWNRCRYELYMPTWLELKAMELFARHLFSFGTTQIARSHRSDEAILKKKVGASIGLFFSDTIGEVVGKIHQRREQEADETGDIYGAKLERKLLNPWLYSDVSLFSDRPEVIRTIDCKAGLKRTLRKVVHFWDEIVQKVQLENFVRLGVEISNAKIKKGIEKEKAMEESIEAAAKHPDFLKFRLAMTMTFDSSHPEETLRYWGRVIGLPIFERVLEQAEGKLVRSRWESLVAQDAV